MDVIFFYITYFVIASSFFYLLLSGRLGGGCCIRKTLTVMLFAVIVAGCREGKVESLGNEGDTVIVLRHTPVKNQGNTSSCWIHAMLACIETERIEQYNDSIGLSAEWLMEKNSEEIAMRRRMMMHSLSGRMASAGNAKRGMGPDALRLMEHYGIVPDKIRTGRDDGFYLFGMHYTPKQLAGSVHKKGDWQWFTSFSHHNYGEAFALEVPDNHHFNEFMNVTPDSLLALAIHSVENHHPVFWEGCMKPFESGDGMSKNEGSMSKNGGRIGKITMRRQSLFERGLLTDDHAMAIIGIRHGSHPAFILKNSWGKDWGKNGYCTMTFEEFLLRTMIIGIRHT